MLWPTSTTRSAPASARTASTARANTSIDSLPSFGESLRPCPGKSIVMTRWSFENAGTCEAQDELSHVQPCTNTIAGPEPTDDELIFMPSSVAADAGSANGTTRSDAAKAPRILLTFIVLSP